MRRRGRPEVGGGEPAASDRLTRGCGCMATWGDRIERARSAYPKADEEEEEGGQRAEMRE